MKLPPLVSWPTGGDAAYLDRSLGQGRGGRSLEAAASSVMVNPVALSVSADQAIHLVRPAIRTAPGCDRRA